MAKAKQQPRPSRAEKVKPVKAWAEVSTVSDQINPWSVRTKLWPGAKGFIPVLIVPDDGSYTVTPKAGRRK